jgi:predicted PurR-regulated permease PerM
MNGPVQLPPTFQRLGTAAWLVVGMVLVIVGGIWLLSETASIVEPLICGTIIATVAGVLVDRLQDHHAPRAIGAALVILGLAVVGVAVTLAVLGGITSQAAQIDTSTSHAVDKVQGWLNDLGITSAQDVAKDVKQDVPDIGHTLLTGVAHGISGLKSLLVFLGFTIFATFFLLKDGPSIGRWIEEHMGLPPAQARIVTGGIAHALRKYFLALTIIGAFNAVLVGLGALVLGVPLPGTIAVVTFIASYVPILGAWTAGFFAFALALANQGTTAGLTMALIVFLANGPLQQIVAPITYGATLRLNPLVVFSVTIAAGSLFGTTGLILGAPLLSAAVQINTDTKQLRASSAPDQTSPAGTPPAGTPPAGAPTVAPAV